ncbi:MAG: hypothetical protein APF76_16160 [Desulfitibacter sp. BRH_c19]|nr:MAG: hypothetical protein APF76_16160 [Desulfitibacter sp. BRH_c19]
MTLKGRIINSAYELFSTKGYEKTTIEAIIKKAQCAKGGFYHHFKSKEQILEVIVSNYIDDISKDFKNIVLSDDSFSHKFNAIFMGISQYKLKQLKEWSKVNNVFSFVGNETILRQLEKQFKIVTTNAYFEIISDGKENGTIDVEHPEILAELCTREILWIYEAAGKLIHSDDIKEYEMYEKLLDFIEGIISHSLGLPKGEVKFKEIALSYLQNLREYFLGIKEELR